MKLILESQNPEKDISAIANSRIARAEGNRQTYWIVGIIIAVGLGFYIRTTSVALGWGLCIAGLLAFVYYIQSLSKKQKDYRIQLLNEWRAGQQKGQETK